MTKPALIASVFVLLFSNHGNALDFARDTLYEPVLTGNPAYTTTKTSGFPVAVEVIDSIRYEAAPGAAQLGYLPELQLSLNGKHMICRQGKCESEQLPGKPVRLHLDTLLAGKLPATLAFLGMDYCVSSCPVFFTDCPCACQNAALSVVHMTFFTSIPGGNTHGETGVFLMGDSYLCAARYVNPFATNRLAGTRAVHRPVGGVGSRCGCQVNGRKTGQGPRVPKS
jgi:hypothetical protein